jgi:hypothetical protein
MNALADCSHDDTVRVFSGVIRLWLECIALQTENDMIARGARQAENNTSLIMGGADTTPTPLPVEVTSFHTSFYTRAKKALWKRIMDVDSTLFRIIQFSTLAAQQNTTVRLSMLDAGSLVIVLAAFTNNDFQLAGLVPSKKATKVKSGRRDSVVKSERRWSVTGSGRRSSVTGSERGEDVVGTCSNPLPLPIAAINAGAATLLVVMRYATFREFWGNKRFNTRLSLCSSLVDSLLGEEGEEGASKETRRLFKEIVSQ